MATQTTDGRWTETLALPMALQAFMDALKAGTAKRFLVGTKQEIEEEKAGTAVEDELASMNARLTMLEARADQSLVAVPTLAEVREHGKLGGVYR